MQSKCLGYSKQVIYLVSFFKEGNEKKQTATACLYHNRTHCAHSESIFPHNVTCFLLNSWQCLQGKAVLTAHYYFGVWRGIIHPPYIIETVFTLQNLFPTLTSVVCISHLPAI